jgi:hypothetical protein
MNRPVPGGPRKRDARNVYSNYLAAEEAVAPSRDQITRRRWRVEEFASRFSFVSPIVSMQYVTEEVAGNSFARYREFGERAEAFQKEWQAYFARKVWRLEEMSLKDIDRRPRFHAESTGAGGRMQRIVVPGSALLLWFAASGAALFWRIRRFSLA